MNVYAPPVSVPDAQSRKTDAIPQSDLTPWILTLAQMAVLGASFKSL